MMMIMTTMTIIMINIDIITTHSFTGLCLEKEVGWALKHIPKTVCCCRNYNHRNQLTDGHTICKHVKNTDLVDWLINIQVPLTSEEVTAHFKGKCEGLHGYYIGSCPRGSPGCSFGLSRIPASCTWCCFGSATPLVKRRWLFVGMRFLITVAIFISLDYPLYYAYGSSETIIIWQWRDSSWENYLKLIMSSLVWVNDLFNLKPCFSVLILSELFQKSCQCLRYVHMHETIYQPLQYLVYFYFPNQFGLG